MYANFPRRSSRYMEFKSLSVDYFYTSNNMFSPNITPRVLYTGFSGNVFKTLPSQ